MTSNVFIQIKIFVTLGMVVYSFISLESQRQPDLYKVKGRSFYIVSSRPIRATSKESGICCLYEIKISHIVI